MSDFWKRTRERRTRDAILAKARTGVFGDPGTCACCGDQASQIETSTGACLLCFVDSTIRGIPKSCHACARGGRVWHAVKPGAEPPLGAALRARDGAIEYSDPILPREDA